MSRPTDTQRDARLAFDVAVDAMIRPTDAQRGARLAYQLVQEAFADLPLFPDLAMTPAARAEWQGIAAAVHDELELQAWSRGLVDGR